MKEEGETNELQCGAVVNDEEVEWPRMGASSSLTTTRGGGGKEAMPVRILILTQARRI
jgi:hypothetical protein